MPTPNKQLAAVCGLFCQACAIYIASTEDPPRLAALAQRYGTLPEKIRCYGCRSEQRFPFCATCKMSACAAEKGIDFCVQCDEYPCPELEAFQAQATHPHRLELWRSQARIQEAGYEQWYAEQVEFYRCSECGTINSTYDLKCRSCGTSPSCAFVQKHWDAIVNRPPLQRPAHK